MAREQAERFDEGLGRAIKVLRTERGVERKELAGSAGISYSYLAEIENGAKPAPSRVLLEIAGALGLSLSELVEAGERLTREGSIVEYRRTSPPPRAMMEPMAAAPPPPAAAAPPPDAAASRSWFPSRARARAGSSGREDQEELAELLERLSPEDRERVLDLARRLAGG